MRRLGRVDEQGGRAGGSERGGDLARDMTRFAHAGDDHPARGRQQQIHRRGEVLVDRVMQQRERAALLINDFASEAQQIGRSLARMRPLIGLWHNTHALFETRRGNPVSRPPIGAILKFGESDGFLLRLA